jgi:hypothetical protein
MMNEQESHPNQALGFSSLTPLAFEDQVKTHFAVLGLDFEFIGSIYKLI